MINDLVLVSQGVKRPEDLAPRISVWLYDTLTGEHPKKRYYPDKFHKPDKWLTEAQFDNYAAKAGGTFILLTLNGRARVYPEDSEASSNQVPAIVPLNEKQAEVVQSPIQEAEVIPTSQQTPVSVLESSKPDVIIGNDKSPRKPIPFEEIQWQDVPLDGRIDFMFPRGQ